MKYLSTAFLLTLTLFQVSCSPGDSKIIAETDILDDIEKTIEQILMIVCGQLEFDNYINQYVQKSFNSTYDSIYIAARQNQCSQYVNSLANLQYLFKTFDSIQHIDIQLPNQNIDSDAGICKSLKYLKNTNIKNLKINLKNNQISRLSPYECLGNLKVQNLSLDYSQNIGLQNTDIQIIQHNLKQKEELKVLNLNLEGLDNISINSYKYIRDLTNSLKNLEQFTLNSTFCNQTVDFKNGQFLEIENLIYQTQNLTAQAKGICFVSQCDESCNQCREKATKCTQCKDTHFLYGHSCKSNWIYIMPLIGLVITLMITFTIVGIIKYRKGKKQPMQPASDSCNPSSLLYRSTSTIIDVGKPVLENESNSKFNRRSKKSDKLPSYTSSQSLVSTQFLSGIKKLIEENIQILTYEEFQTKYTYVTSINTGSFGSVSEYRMNLKSGEFKQVAIKTINKKIYNIETEYYRIGEGIKEAQIQQGLAEQCEFVVNVNDYFLYEQDDQESYGFAIVMEFAQASLSQQIQEAIRKNCYFTEEHVVTILRQISIAYIQMQKFNITHRDIKPANILYCDRIYKLCDFGASKVLQNVDDLTMVKGTLDYLSPEQRQNYIASLQLQKDNIQQVDHYKSDIFSLGVTAFQLLTLNRNIASLNLKKTCLTKEINSMKEKKKQSICPELLDIVENMLNWEPEERMTWSHLYNFTTQYFIHKQQQMQQQQQQQQQQQMQLQQQQMQQQQMEQQLNQNQQKQSQQNSKIEQIDKHTERQSLLENQG